MGKASNRKHNRLIDECQVKLEKVIDWTQYDILEITGDTVLARKKNTDTITIICPVASWELDGLLDILFRSSDGHLN